MVRIRPKVGLKARIRCSRLPATRVVRIRPKVGLKESLALMCTHTALCQN